MTQDVYMARKGVDARVAEALEDALGKTPADEDSAKKREQNVSSGPPGRRTATLQACDLHLCAPREN